MCTHLGISNEKSMPNNNVSASNVKNAVENVGSLI
jgi:hypothetical protein